VQIEVLDNCTQKIIFHISMSEIYSLIITVVLFSTIQSIFGVGLLMFGTPTLLLIGFSYSETLWFLLPCSLVISLIQTVNNYDFVQSKKKAAYLTIPTMILSLSFVLIFDSVLDVTKIVGFFLLIIGILRISSRLQSYFKYFINRQLHLYYVFIGLVHGISNMGGGPLSILMSTVHADKLRIRANVAFVYLTLTVFQLIVLFTIDSNRFQYVNIILVTLSLSAYFIVNKFFSNMVSNKKYLMLLNILILVCGLIALLK